MDLKWNLDALYPGFESKEFQDDLALLEKMIAEAQVESKQLSDATDHKATLAKIIENEKALSAVIIKTIAFTQLTFSTDVNNAEAGKYLDKLMRLHSQLTESEVLIKRYLMSIENLEEIIESSDSLKEHKYVIEKRKKSASYLLSDREEILASKLRITGSDAWGKLQGILTSNLEVAYEKDGKTEMLPIMVVRNMAYDADPEVRKAAYEAEIKAYEKVEEGIAGSLNAIKGEVLTMCELRGYESPLEMTLQNSNMSKATLDAMLSAMDDALPHFHKYMQKKAELLNHKNGLPFYDMFAPMGSASKTYNYDEAKVFVEDKFREFSDRLADYAKLAFDKEWIDVTPRKGKSGGAFCFPIHAIKESRIMLNFTGVLSDILTLAHELGHGYHAYNQIDESILNTEDPMPLAETASTFCETVVNNAILDNADAEEKFTILENSLQDATQIICDIYSRYKFESSVFETRSDAPLSVDEFKNLILDAQKYAYGSGLDHENLHPYMWAIKGHYYSAGLNFYNFPYAFGLLFAKGLYAEYLKRGESFKADYDRLLSSTGKFDIVDVCKIMDIDVEDKAFWDASLKLITDDIATFIDLADKRK